MRLKSRERHGSTHPHIEICGWCSWSSSLCSDGPVTKSTDSDRQVPSGMTARGRQSEQTYTNIYMHWVYPITSNSLLAVAGNRTDPIHAHIQHINYLYSQIYFFKNNNNNKTYTHVLIYIIYMVRVPRKKKLFYTCGFWWLLNICVLQFLIFLTRGYKSIFMENTSLIAKCLNTSMSKELHCI